MRHKVLIDLYCGLGGWTRGFLAEGYECIGFDIERHQYGDKRYPAQLVLQDVLTLHGRQFRDVAAIVASPPCQKYSYMAMPWSLAKQQAAEIRQGGQGALAELNALFDACFRLQREASEAAGHEIPMVVENVKGAQPWVGRAAWHYGSYYLWGDVPALMPTTQQLKQAGRNFHFPEKYGIPSPSFHGAEHESSVQRAMGVKTNDHVNKRDGFDHTRHLTNQRESDAVKVPGIKLNEVGFNVAAAQQYRDSDAIKQHGSGAAWWNKALDERWKRATAAQRGEHIDRKDRPGYPYSPGDSRKAASAMIAEIPFDLAQWIARCFKP